MEGFVGGTEIQLGVQRLHPEFSVTTDYDNAVKELIDANSKLNIYGIRGTGTEGGQYINWLFNGGLLYHDLQHPEYATPECRSLKDIINYEFAGRRITQSLIELVTRPLKTQGFAQYGVFANNVDHYLAADQQIGYPLRPTVFAYHENYAATNPVAEVDLLLPFLVTRHVFAGAGFVLQKELREKWKTDFLIAQRAAAVYAQGSALKVGLFSFLAGESRHNTKILHITVGDANVSPYATRLKIGTTILVHQLIEKGWKPPLFLIASSPDTLVGNARSLCIFNSSFRWMCRFSDRSISAIDVQRIYLEAAWDRFAGRDPETDWTLLAWMETLDQLERDPMECVKLDWVLKKRYLDDRGHRLTSAEQVRFDIAYHAANPQKSAFLALAKHYGVDDLPNEETIEHAIKEPPTNTRALGRSLAVRAISKQNGQEIPHITWSGIQFKGQHLPMPSPSDTYQKASMLFAKNLEQLSSSKERRG
ncbi:MAG: proteasome accessory factor PafA2 family protein [bacterium]|nr:proteasome accessory factor PafA2 family protein [bacterium]